MCKLSRKRWELFRFSFYLCELIESLLVGKTFKQIQTTCRPGLASLNINCVSSTIFEYRLVL